MNWKDVLPSVPGCLEARIGRRLAASDFRALPVNDPGQASARLRARMLYARFRRALESGNLTLVRAAAAELPRINLDDALRVCLLLRAADAAGYERAAVRWLGRFALEHPSATLAMLHQAVAAFERLPDDPESARRELRTLIRG